MLDRRDWKGEMVNVGLRVKGLMLDRGIGSVRRGLILTQGGGRKGFNGWLMMCWGLEGSNYKYKNNISMNCT